MRPATVSNSLTRTGDAERLTGGPESVVSPDGRTRLVVSPDGRTVALCMAPLPHTGEMNWSFVRLLDLGSGESRDLPLVPMYPGSFSPDGRTLSTIGFRGPLQHFDQSAVLLQPLGGGAPVDVAAEIDRNLEGPAWLPDGQSLLVHGPDLTSQAIWHQPLDGGPRRLDLAGIHAGSPVVGADGTVVFVGREAQRPDELYVMQAGEWAPRRLTDFNDPLASMKLGEVATVSWDGPDGFAENGVLIYPPDFERGRRYPLVLSIHGGPMNTSTEAFSTFNQIMAAQGWLVFSPDYRGSTNQEKASSAPSSTTPVTARGGTSCRASRP